MSMLKLAAAGTRLRRIGRSLRRVLETRYPTYLYGSPRGVDLCPAFIYHDVSPEEFEGDLMFLRDNGYRTLSTEEFVEHANQSPDGHAVLLTFDDARRSFFDVALPLLKKYEMKATLFVPTRWITRDDEPSVAISDPRLQDSIFMDWRQVETCARTGLVDIQSHAHRHALVYTTQRLVTFCTPALLKNHDIYDWPMRRQGSSDVLGPPPLGTPIFEAMPLLSAGRRLIEDETVSKLCTQYVMEHGGTCFFEKPDWERELRAYYKRISQRSSWQVMDNKAFQDLVESEFSLPEQMFTAYLGKKPRYLAYPWMLGTRDSLHRARNHGIAAVFGVGIDYRRRNSMGNVLPVFGRTKCDWLRFMPGRGRRSLATVLPDKIMSFFKNQHISH